MKRIFDIIRFTFISPEFLWVLVGVVLLYSYPLPLAVVGDKISSNNEVWKWLPTLPILFASVAFRFSLKVRAPFDKGNKQLYEWYSYNRITDRIYAAYILVSVSVVSNLSIWMFTEVFTSPMLGFVFLASIGVSGFVALQIFLAAQKIREILEQFGGQP